MKGKSITEKCAIQNDDYALAYGKDYEIKMKRLEEEILSSKSRPNHFTVFNFEAGLGKSKKTLEVIDKYLQGRDTKLSFLIVRRFNTDIARCVKFLEGHNNKLKTNVLGITSENWKEWKFKIDKLKSIKVLIISHKRYIDLCLDDNVRKAFMENRDVLIIDEKVNFPSHTFTKDIYNEIHAILPTSLESEYSKVCKRLNEELEKQKLKKNVNKVVRCEPKVHPATLKNFKKTIEANYKNIGNTEEVDNVKNFVLGLEQWYKNKCLYNGGNISTYNPKHRLWGLNNNIILDASAGIDGIYQFDKFDVIGQKRIIDHCNSKFTVVNVNTSKSSLYHNKNEFFPEICEMIKDRHKINDKTLVICHKDNRKSIKDQLHKNDIGRIGFGDDYNGEEYAINWFGNLIGKNEYTEFTQCWIVGTPNLPYEQYLIHYMMYNESDIGRKSTEIVNGRFKNNEFKNVQIGYVAAEIYQSIKRIQRVSIPRGEFFIINNDPNIVSIVLSQIKGAKIIEEIEMEFEVNKKIKSPDKADEFISYVNRLERGKYSKKMIAEAIGIRPSNIGRILTNSKVKALLPGTSNSIGLGMIKIHNKEIEKLTDPDFL